MTPGRERGAGGREARVQLKESSCCGRGDTGAGTAVKMQKHKGWPGGCDNQNPFDGSGLRLLDSHSVKA